jgi:hypothetical protein
MRWDTESSHRFPMRAGAYRPAGQAVSTGAPANPPPFLIYAASTRSAGIQTSEFAEPCMISIPRLQSARRL